jgi:hypothetical protein
MEANRQRIGNVALAFTQTNARTEGLVTALVDVTERLGARPTDEWLQ